MYVAAHQEEKENTGKRKAVEKEKKQSKNSRETECFPSAVIHRAAQQKNVCVRGVSGVNGVLGRASPILTQTKRSQGPYHHGEAVVDWSSEYNDNCLDFGLHLSCSCFCVLFCVFFHSCPATSNMSLMHFGDTLKIEATSRKASRDHIIWLKMFEKADSLNDNFKTIIRSFCQTLIASSHVDVIEDGYGLG